MSSTNSEADFLGDEARTVRSACFGAIAMNIAVIGLYFNFISGDVFFDDLRDYFVIAMALLNFFLIYRCYVVSTEVTDFSWSKVNSEQPSGDAQSYEYDYHARRLRIANVTAIATAVPYLSFLLVYNIPFWPEQSS